MTTPSRFGKWTSLALMASAVLAAVPAWGAVTPSGDVSPADPATWTSSTTGFVGNTSIGGVTVNSESKLLSGFGYLGYSSGSLGTVSVDGSGSTWSTTEPYVGYSGTGTLFITHGGRVNNGWGYLGYNAGATGTATVDGTNSTWTIGDDLHVGRSGTGNLNITNGGRVSINSNGFLGYNTGATGTATVDGTGSAWTTQSHLDVGHSGTGTLAITNGATVGGFLVSIGLNNGSSGTATVDGIGSTLFDNTLVVGSSGIGKLNIANGGKVSSAGLGDLGFNTGAVGTATIDGAGSTWTTAIRFYVGNSGTGTLKITDAGQVSDSDGYIGNATGGTGTATVDGTGSAWTNSGALAVGNSGTGTLKITNGGTVTATGVSINSSSLLAMSVGDASRLSAGTGTLTNSGVIWLKAVANAAAGPYTPITATSWSGAGTVTALGGTWDSAAHAFLVSAASSGAAGQGVAIDRSVTQRVTITDPTAGSVWAGFMATANTSSLTFSALPLTDGQKGPLIEILGAGGTVLAGWTFTADGYTAGEPVFLSMEIGAGHGGDNLAVWHFDGAAWSSYAASDLSYDGEYADFTVTGFSGYAVVAVPEPGCAAILSVGALGLLIRRRRRRDKVTG